MLEGSTIVSPAEGRLPQFLIGVNACVRNNYLAPYKFCRPSDLGRRPIWSDEEKVRMVEESLHSDRDRLPNGRRLTIPASLERMILARDLPKSR
ncbi:hypothetical protein IE4771_PB00239 (plasmid) [Rhizobium etli bv. mimosae str. IE4771]|uniref:Uncharacterized protein n=1 Tax=Rhizobium etli bv. mimosae str. IE4771 TaxID=1432050 RepID=A0A060I8B4_RHIET|nr:hypothetical protein IE4771_PB00239 [Rhizobium sp. IE4771]